jgi:hypothetical protein
MNKVILSALFSLSVTFLTSFQIQAMNAQKKQISITIPGFNPQVVTTLKQVIELGLDLKGQELWKFSHKKIRDKLTSFLKQYDYVAHQDLTIDDLFDAKGHFSIEDKEIDLLALLLDKRFDPNEAMKINGNTLLHFMDKKYKTEWIRVLLACGADPFIKNDASHLACHHTITTCQPKHFVLYLQHHFENPYFTEDEDDKKTILHFITKARPQFLIEPTYKPFFNKYTDTWIRALSEQDKTGNTPAHIAFNEIVSTKPYNFPGWNAKILKTILELGPKVTSIKNSDGISIIDMAKAITDPVFKKAVAAFIN